MLKMSIGNRVLAILKEKGLKQKDLAEYLHTGSSTVNGWKSENRNPSSDMIIPICEFLSVSPIFLLTGEEDNPYTDVSPPDIDPQLLQLIRELDREQQIELRGYVRGRFERSVAADPAEAPAKMAK